MEKARAMVLVPPTWTEEEDIAFALPGTMRWN